MKRQRTMIFGPQVVLYAMSFTSQTTAEMDLRRRVKRAFPYGMYALFQAAAGLESLITAGGNTEKADVLDYLSMIPIFIT